MEKLLTLRLIFVVQGACLISLVQSSITTKPEICPPSPPLSSPYSDVDISDYDLDSLRCNICNNNKILVCLSKIIEAIKKREQDTTTNNYDRSYSSDKNEKEEMVTEASIGYKDISKEKTEVEREKNNSDDTISHSDKYSSEHGSIESHKGKSIEEHDSEKIGIEGQHEEDHLHEENNGYQEHVQLHGYKDHEQNHEVHEDGDQEYGSGNQHTYNSNDQHTYESNDENTYNTNVQHTYNSSDKHTSNSNASVIMDSGVSTIEGNSEKVEGVPTIEEKEKHISQEYSVPEIISDSHKPDYEEIPSQHTHIEHVYQGTVPIVPSVYQQPKQPILHYYEHPPCIPGPASGPTYTQTGIVTPDAAPHYLKPNFWEYPYPWFIYSPFPPVHPSGNIHHEFVVQRNCTHEHKFPVDHGIPDQHIWTGDCFENTRSLILSPPCNQDINRQKITRHVTHNLGGAGTTNSKSVTNIVSKHYKTE